MRLAQAFLYRRERWNVMRWYRPARPSRSVFRFIQFFRQPRGHQIVLWARAYCCGECMCPRAVAVILGSSCAGFAPFWNRGDTPAPALSSVLVSHPLRFPCGTVVGYWFCTLNYMFECVVTNQLNLLLRGLLHTSLDHNGSLVDRDYLYAAPAIPPAARPPAEAK